MDATAYVNTCLQFGVQTVQLRVLAFIPASAGLVQETGITAGTSYNQGCFYPRSFPKVPLLSPESTYTLSSYL